MLEGHPIDLDIAQIVHTDMKGPATGLSKQHFQRLWRNFCRLKGHLLLGIAPIRQIPVAVILETSTASPGNTPVADLMQGAGKIAAREDDLVKGA